jgi:hypothetical protein
MSKAARLAEERRKTEKLLHKLGFFEAKRKYGKVRPIQLPDLTVQHNVAPTSDKIGNGFARPPLPADAKVFPVGQSHKQGPMLIGSFDDLTYMGGKKT